MDWPLLPKLAAGVIGARLDRNDTVKGALDYVNRAYEKRGLTAFDPKDAERRFDAAAKSIEASLELLNQDERTKLGALAIFPENTDVPLRMIELLWNQDDLETQDGTKRLADFSLLDLDLHTGTVHLHDEIRFYVGPTISNGAPCTQGLSTELEIPKISAVATLYAGFHGTSARRVEMLRDVLCSSTSSGC